MSVLSIRTARFRRAVVAMMAMVPLMFVAQATMGAGTAEARCAGVGNPIVGTLVINGNTFVTETPAANTCDDDRNYITTLQSKISNGWRASMILSDANNNHYGGWSTGYNGTPVTVGAGVYMCCPIRITLCIDDGWSWYCGYGSNYVWDSKANLTYYGDHTGF
jgi:hypothetical protein